MEREFGLRSFLAQLEKEGLLRRVSETADPEGEIGLIMRKVFMKGARPSFLSR